jgi:Protein of unknown function (DUF2959)
MYTPSRSGWMVYCLGMMAILAGCSSVYYAAWEKLGYEKRDILVSRVEDERDDQTKAKEQFKSTLDQFKAVTNFNGGSLEDEYKKLKSSYDDCKDRADAVSKEINSVDNVANAMFDEWTKELDDYHDENLRAASEQKLNDSRARYADFGCVRGSRAFSAGRHRRRSHQFAVRHQHRNRYQRAESY